MIKELYKRWKYGVNMKNVSADPEFDKDYYPFFYRGIRIEQNPFIFEFLNKLSRETKPARIIELGYRYGGFTLLLDDHKLSKDSFIYAYDKIPSEKAPVSNKVNRAHCDVFKKIEEIGAIIQCKGTSLVFCDGGDKNLEFNLLAPYLKEGDVIMTHDYAPNIKVFEEEYLGKRWDWLESWDGKMTNTIREQNLKPFCTEEANAAVWSCYIK